jgi:transposase
MPRFMQVPSNGGGRAWAMIATLTTAKMNGVDPNARLTLKRIAGGWPNSQIADLMPWNFSADASAAVR